MNTNWDSHQHVLWSLYNFAMYFKEVSPFKSLETEKVVVPVSFVINGFLNFFFIGTHNFENIFRDQWGIGA